MKFIDFFAGIGGFRLGMEQAGHECLGHCEIDKYADASYRMMHTVTDEQREHLMTLSLKERQKEIRKEEYLNGEWYASDITGIEPGDIPEADCYCGGFPCQAFSIAGQRRGFEDTRGTLFFDIARLAAERKPRILFLENVKGLLNHQGGDTFTTIISTLDSIGYDAEWMVCNSKDYVPQNRERIFIIGHFRGRGGRKVFPLGRTDSEDSVQQIGKCKSETRDNPKRQAMIARLFNPTPDGTARTIKAQYYKTSKRNFTRADGFGATGVIVIDDEKIHRPESGGGNRPTRQDALKHATRQDIPISKEIIADTE